jgi:hypothetical protein
MMKLINQLKNFWKLIEQGLRQLADVGKVVEHRHLQIEHEQRHRDREDAVAEGLDASEVQLALREAMKEAHCPRHCCRTAVKRYP